MEFCVYGFKNGQLIFTRKKFIQFQKLLNKLTYRIFFFGSNSSLWFRNSSASSKIQPIVLSDIYITLIFTFATMELESKSNDFLLIISTFIIFLSYSPSFLVATWLSCTSSPENQHLEVSITQYELL